MEQSVISGNSFEPSCICCKISDRGDIDGSISTGGAWGATNVVVGVAGVTVLVDMNSTSLLDSSVFCGLFTLEEDEVVEDEDDSIVGIFNLIFFIILNVCFIFTVDPLILSEILRVQYFEIKIADIVTFYPTTMSD